MKSLVLFLILLCRDTLYSDLQIEDIVFQSSRQNTTLLATWYFLIFYYTPRPRLGKRLAGNRESVYLNAGDTDYYDTSRVNRYGQSIDNGYAYMYLGLADGIDFDDYIDDYIRLSILGEKIINFTGFIMTRANSGLMLFSRLGYSGQNHWLTIFNFISEIKFNHSVYHLE